MGQEPEVLKQQTADQPSRYAQANREDSQQQKLSSDLKRSLGLELKLKLVVLNSPVKNDADTIIKHSFSVNN